MNLSLAKLVDRRLGSLVGGVVGAADRLGEALRPPEPVTAVRRVLVVKFWGLGNWSLLRPVLRDLRERWPRASFTVATLAPNRPLVEDLADHVLLVRPRGLVVLAEDLLAAVRALRRRPPDLALDFEQFSRAGALLARLGGARQRIGFASGAAGRDGLYTVLVPIRPGVHAARSFRDLAEAAGVPPGPYVPGALWPDAGARERARTRLPEVPYVVLHPGSGDNFPGRRWSEAGFAAVGRTALELGLGVVVTGGAPERDLAERVARAVGGGAASLAGLLSLDELVAVVAGARALVSNDTGPVHLASAAGTPTLAIYGPNTPALYGPLAPGSRSFYRALPCSPCLTAVNYRSSRCRIHTCMASIPTGEVCAALRALLQPAARSEARP